MRLFLLFIYIWAASSQIIPEDININESSYDVFEGIDHENKSSRTKNENTDNEEMFINPNTTELGVLNELSIIIDDLLTGALSDIDVLFITRLKFDKASHILPRTLERLRSVIVYTSSAFDQLCDKTKYEFYQRSMVTILLFDEDVTTFLDSQSNSPSFASKYILLLSLNPSFNSSDEDILQHQSVQRSRYITYMKFESDLFSVYKIYPHVLNSDLRIKRKLMGSYNKDSVSTLDSLFELPDYNLQGATLQGATWCDDHPFLYLDSEGECTGISVDVLTILSEKFNFSFMIQLEPPDQVWGSFENGSWQGMFLQTFELEKHFIANSVGLNLAKYNYFDVSYPYFLEEVSFLLKIPDPPNVWLNLVYPFSKEIWIIYIITALIIIGFLTFLLRVVPDSQPSNTAFLLIVSSIFNQSYLGKIFGPSARLMIITWVFSSYILTIGYTSNFIAFLSAPLEARRIQTISHLRKSTITPMMEDYGSFVPGRLRSSSDPNLRVIGEKLELIPLHGGNMCVKGIGRVVGGGHALLETSSYLAYIRSQHPEAYKTYFMREKIYPSYVCFMFPKNTAYSEIFSYNIQRLLEVGILNKLKADHRNVEVRPPEVAPWKPLKLESFFGMFMLASMCLVVSSLVFCCEIFWGSKKN